jgi:hypothetical protein
MDRRLRGDDRIGVKPLSIPVSHCREGRNPRLSLLLSGNGEVRCKSTEAGRGLGFPLAGRGPHTDGQEDSNRRQVQPSKTQDP